MDDTIKIVGICGSLREGSHTLMGLKHALQGAEASGCEVELIDLSKNPLPLCDGGNSEDLNVQKLKDAVKGAQGIILATPEYHGTFSGVMKNTIDHLSIDEFKGKMVGLVAIAGGKAPSTLALNGLRNICRALHAWVIPDQVTIPIAWEAFNDAGEILDEKLLERVHNVGAVVAKYAAIHHHHKD